LRLVDRVYGTIDDGLPDLDDDLIVLDVSPSFAKCMNVNFHFYRLNASEGTIPQQGSTGGDVPGATGDESWFGFTLGRRIGNLGLEGLVMINEGEMEGKRHLGLALGIGGDWETESLTCRSTLIATTGDREGAVDGRFVSLHGILGTSGYWVRSHIFTPNPASDVNEIGIEPGNSGAGLVSLQTELRLSVWDGSDISMGLGLFGSWMPRNGSRWMGQEVSIAFRRILNEFTTFDVGYSRAFMGGFYGEDPPDLNELFSRLQFSL